MMFDANKAKNSKIKLLMHIITAFSYSEVKPINPELIFIINAFHLPTVK